MWMRWRWSGREGVGWDCEKAGSALMIHNFLLGGLIWLDCALVGWLFFAWAGAGLDEYGAGHEDE